MGISLGSGAIAGLKLGAANVSKVMLGATQVWAPAGAARSQTYDAKAVQANSATYTLSAMNIGAADANRRVVVAFGSRRASTTVSSVTLGGVSVTALQQASISGGASRIWLGVATVPTGTTADLVVVFSASDDRAVVAATAALVGYSLPVKASGIDTAPALSIGSIDASGANTVAIAAHWCRAVTATTTGIFTAGVTQQVAAAHVGQSQAIHLGAATDVNNASLTIAANTYGTDAMMVVCTLGAS